MCFEVGRRDTVEPRRRAWNMKEQVKHVCIRRRIFFYVNTMLTPNQYVTVHLIKVSFKVRFYLFVFIIIVFSLIFFYVFRLQRVNYYDVFSTVSF